MTTEQTQIRDLVHLAQRATDPAEVLRIVQEVDDLKTQWSQENEVIVPVTKDTLNSLRELGHEKGLMTATVAELALREYINHEEQSGAQELVGGEVSG